MILVANPGSSSRKYALFDDTLSCVATLHIEKADHQLLATLYHNGEERHIALQFDQLTDAAAHIESVFRSQGVLAADATIDGIGVRIVAPGNYFLSHRLIDDELLMKLREAKDLAPLHIAATLGEIESLRAQHPDTPLAGISDSEFHSKKPPYAWNYGINIQDADRLDIKRFGYHGISTAASVRTLWSAGKLPPKVVVCHLGSGSSISAVFHGRSIDTTMGFTPNEGLMMATRSGSISYDAVRALQSKRDMTDDATDHYLNNQSGLRGLGGSDDLRELIAREADGDHMAHLALTTFVHTIHKAVGGMIAALNGCDLLVFTGTVGERSAIIRRRIIAHLQFADFILDGDKNDATTNPSALTFINQQAKSRPIVVIPANEAYEIARSAKALL